MPDVLVPIVGTLVLFGAPVAAWIVSRVLQHNEYMAMIRMGMTPPPDSRMMRNAMRRGWVPPGGFAQGPGVAPGAQPYGAPGAGPNDWYGYGTYGYAWNPQRKLQRGITVALVGLAIFIGLSFISPGHVGPWLLGGLVPMFVGIAQIISAVLSGAQFGGFGGAPNAGPGPGQSAPFQSGAGPFGQPSQPPPTPPTNGPYGWRPGAMPEIKKPVNPPDQR